LLAGRAIPSLEAIKSAELFRRGWRMVNSLAADGPDGGMFGLGKAETLCLVSRRQPAYIDDKTRQIVQSESLEITLQCGPR
jgi:hypothetical protein